MVHDTRFVRCIGNPCSVYDRVERMTYTCIDVDHATRLCGLLNSMVNDLETAQTELSECDEF